jgi:type II secretory pathway component PulM
MSRFQSLFAWSRRLSPRERRILIAGALVSASALLAVWVVLPFVERWQFREESIATQRARLMQLQSLIQEQSGLRQSLASRQRAHPSVRARLLTGSTPALAASDLQALLQRYADQSQVNLDRVDPVAEPGAPQKGELPAIPVRLTGQGDIYGLTALLNNVQHGEKLLVVDELSVNAGGVAGSHPDVLVFSVRLHGLYRAE